MPSQLRPVQPSDPLIPARRTTVPLKGGYRLEVLPDVPTDAAGRRLAVENAVLYGILGVRTDVRVPNVIGGYIGKSEALTSTRANRSYTQWVLTQKAFTPTGMGLLFTENRNQPPDFLTVVESRVIQRLSSDMGMVALTNTHTSAERAAARLGTADLTAAVDLADEVAYNLWVHVLHCRTNAWPAPASNSREAAVRIVMRASNLERRALDTFEVLKRLNENGYPSNGKTRWRSVLRDLRTRERDSLCPRVFAVNHRGRVLYRYHTLTEGEAIRGYDQAHPHLGPNRYNDWPRA